MISKKEIERKVDHLEENPGESPEDLIFEDLKENFADLEGKDPSEIEETSLGELIKRVRKAMEKENKKTKQKIENIYEDLEDEIRFTKEALRERAEAEGIAKNRVDGWLAEKNML